jgi:hypothetical protein
VPKTYITDSTHFLNDAGEMAEMPAPARKLASFLVLLIDAVTQAYPVRDRQRRYVVTEIAKSTLPDRPLLVEVPW